jgi:hypothetical protein
MKASCEILAFRAADLARQDGDLQLGAPLRHQCEDVIRRATSQCNRGRRVLRPFVILYIVDTGIAFGIAASVPSGCSSRETPIVASDDSTAPRRNTSLLAGKR